MRSISWILFSVTACIAFASGGPRLPAAHAEGGTVKAIFEKYNLLGTFAWDCAQPPSRENNWYFVNRLLDADHVQRDLMYGPTDRAWVAILNKAAELKPNEIMVSGTLDGQPTEGVWRIEQNRMQQWDATQAGKKIIGGGRFLSTGREMPWLNKCDAR